LWSRNLIHAFADGTGSLEEVFKHQAQDMPKWGRGRLYNFYINGLGLNLSDVALGNIAWCSTKGNRYPDKMLRHCFSKHTASLIDILEPDVILLSGTATHRFAKVIRKQHPAAKVVEMLHYAHREGRDVQQAELDRVRGLIAL
ncbi:MAG: hypothetical protein K9N10_22630, partial [Deltaproteobacteria bacterium]|nr:hypothetical protein [Deltaproteobacteria bacterium]